MHQIIPSILPKSYEDLKNKIALVRGFVPVVQIDLCDGHFVPSSTWPFTEGAINEYHFKRILLEEEGLPFWEDMNFELDLLVSDAVENFDIYSKLGASAMIFHVEAVIGEEKSVEDFKDFLEGIDPYVRDSLDIGIALNPSTDTEKIFPLMPFVNFVQFMGSDEIGHSGVELDEKVFEKIKSFREKYPDIKTEVDIGVNEYTAPKLLELGIEKLVIGSAIYNAVDIVGKIEEFKNL